MLLVVFMNYKWDLKATCCVCLNQYTDLSPASYNRPTVTWVFTHLLAFFLKAKGPDQSKHGSQSFWSMQQEDLNESSFSFQRRWHCCDRRPLPVSVMLSSIVGIVVVASLTHIQLWSAHCIHTHRGHVVHLREEDHEEQNGRLFDFLAYSHSLSGG